MRTRTFGWLALLFVVAFISVAGSAFAADAAPVADLASGSLTMEDILRDGGTVGWIIIVLSVATVALIIECGVNIRRDKICRPELIDEIEALLEEDEVQEALELCESEPNFFTNMMAAGLSRANFGYDDIKSSIENRGAVEVTKMQQKVGWILWLSNIGPLLGLFGTVVGMIVAFKTIKALGAAVTPTDLATGISAALVTTFDGLVVSMPAVTAYQYFRDKVTKIAIDLGGVAEDMIQRFRK
ncbi:MAG: MotA/TolQ/ExbB proton channel family protein [Planctomycetia bacterium]|nr:MotA/TolQ/ExbB proton channel family protein [Planctomycetia bacterium]